MTRHLHLIPNADRSTDPVFAAAVAHASTIAETSDPLAAMRAAMTAAGVDRLDCRYDVLLAELDAARARLAEIEGVVATGTSPATPREDADGVIEAAGFDWSRPQRAPAGRRAA